MIGWARVAGGRVRHAFEAERFQGARYRHALCGRWAPASGLIDDKLADPCAGCVKRIAELEKLVRGKRSY
jgi:hypothetical protein